MSKDSSLLIDLLRNAIESRLLDTHTAIPGIVDSFNAAEGTVNVRPAIRRKYKDGTIEALPVIPNVPVCFPSGNGGKSFLSFPLRRNDSVLLVFAERAIDVFKQKSGVVDALDPRKFHLSDAVAIPGLFPKPQRNARISAEHVRLEHEGASIELQSAGKFKIGRPTGDELFDLLSQLAQACSQIANGAGPTANAGTFVTLKTKIDALKG
jgi:hypothetical protein